MGPDIERVDVSEPASISSGIAARYATAVFELAKDASDLKKLESNIDDVRAALADSEDFRVLISSPLYSREDQSTAIAGIAAKMKLMPMLVSALGLMASKRRLLFCRSCWIACMILLQKTKARLQPRLFQPKP
jgi:F-type H+-transporting ATPase subunit delta